MKHSQGPTITIAYCLIIVATLASTTTGMAASANDDIVAIASANDSFQTLTKALGKAGLIDTLRGPGPFTVFAPTDEAFAKLPQSTLNSLLAPENKSKLVDILTYHVVPGRLASGQVLNKKILSSIQGTSILVTKQGGKPAVDRARIIQTDIQASNGVIHVIDSVILPKDLAETAAVAGQFNTLLTAVNAAGLGKALKDPKSRLTVFAPTDQAFANLPTGTVEDLLRPSNKERLTEILKYHIAKPELILGQISLNSLQGQALDVRSSGNITVEEAKIVLADIRATNGVIHVIDRVLLPAIPEPTPVRKAMGLIERAIERGAPLFNEGNPEACTAIYELTARSLLDGYPQALDAASRQQLAKALEQIRQDHRPQRQAWILRYALDDVYKALRKKAQ